MAQAGTFGTHPVKAAIERRLGRQLTEDDLAVQRITAAHQRELFEGFNAEFAGSFLRSIGNSSRSKNSEDSAETNPESPGVRT